MFYLREKRTKVPHKGLEEGSITILVDSGSEEDVKFSYQLYGQDYKPKSLL